MLRFARRVTLQQLAQIDRWIAREERREAERHRAAQARPPVPDWVLEAGIGDRSRPVYVHVGGCHMIGKHGGGVGRDQALRAMAEGVQGCPHCRPDTALGMLE